ncbi:MAG: asparagine synthase (glutamine-hydrolyzing) [Rubrivivax sp.]|nr:MAG: asparagine synthase (glutamine-hydrolyzing) [Rubrivivax sp.]
MCGLTGFWAGTLAFDLEATVAHMADTLYHRGPDGSGVWSDREAGLALGHRRLAILDLSPAGHQPMSSSSGQYVLAFNGEVYNHLLLRQELQASSSRIWRGHSDTETLLAAFEQWGVEATLSRCVGMFAMAIWDRQTSALVLARDRLGEKPLYYGWFGGALLFGSELKALRAFPGCAPEIDRDVLATYLRYNCVPAPRSIYQGIHKVEPGCLLRFTSPVAPSGPRPPMVGSAGSVDVRRWWSLAEVATAARQAPIDDEREAVLLLEARLTEAVRLQSLSDVPLGAFLSGGVDSSTIVALMQSVATSPVRTFTIGFEQSAHDEAAHARLVAQHLGTDHTEMRVSSKDVLDVVPRLPVLYDEPFADSSQLPTFLVCQQARRHVTVALSGDGADELFGGYSRYHLSRRIWDRVGHWPGPLRRVLGEALDLPSPAQWETLARMAAAWKGRGLVSLPGDKAHKLAKLLKSSADLEDLYASLVSEWHDPAAVVLGCSPQLAPNFDAATTEWPEEDRMMFQDALTYLPDDILCKVDRAAMGASLETRVPFLDHRIVELSWRMPLSMKIRDGQGKWAVRQVLYKHVPKALIERPKQGFAAPVADWLRGPLRAWAEALLSESRLKQEGFFHPAVVRRKWDEHVSGRKNWQYSLWSILMFQAWLEHQTVP